MSLTSQLWDLLSFVRDSFEVHVVRNLHQRLPSFFGFLKPATFPASPSFEVKIQHLTYLLEAEDQISSSISSALDELRSLFPQIRVQLIPKGVWPNEPNCHVSIQTHLKSTLEDAIKLLTPTGRHLSASDEEYLQRLLTHVCGWSATYLEHNDDSWVTFFHARYPQLEGLVPILDSMTYPEELVDFPDDYPFPEPRFFLLATSDRYFIYDASDWADDRLFFAGETLKEVYNGLKDWRWAYSYGNGWDVVEEEGDKNLNPDCFFVTYTHKNGGTFGILGDQEEIPGKMRGNLWNCFWRDFWT
jgi:hypothetical protein